MYQHGRRTRQPRNAGVFLVSMAMVGIVVLIGWWIVHKDIGSSTGTRTTVPIVTEVTEDKEETVQFTERYFSFELPSDWKLDSQRVDNNAHFYIYRSTKKGADDRRLTVHVDIMPAVYKLVKLQPISSNGSKFMLGNLSDDCVNFAGSRSPAGVQDNSPFEAKWEGITFMCDPITANQSVGTSSKDGGLGTVLTGSQGPRKFYLFYEDFNIRPEYLIFQNALRSFQAR